LSDSATVLLRAGYAPNNLPGWVGEMGQLKRFSLPPLRFAFGFHGEIIKMSNVYFSAHFDKWVLVLILQCF
jgi:hypothetical protein